jgi:hypothetical protein
VDIVQRHWIVLEQASLKIDSLYHKLETFVDQSEAWLYPRKKSNNRVEDITIVQQRPVKGHFIACCLCGENHYVKHCPWKTATLEENHKKQDLREILEVLDTPGMDWGDTKKKGKEPNQSI